MKSIKILSIYAILALVFMSAIFHHHQNGVEAGKKKILRNALMALLLLNGGKKIVLPLPIPLPVPILKQTQPVYYEQPSYQPSYQHQSYY